MTIEKLVAGVDEFDPLASTGADVAAAVNGLIDAVGAVPVSSFGVVAGNSLDQSANIQACIDYAATNRLAILFDVATARIDGTIYFRSGSRVVGNGCWLLNYGTGDAVSIAPDSADIHEEVCGLNITYRDHLSPLNPYVPVFTLNKNIEPRTSMSFNHLPSFTGAGIRHSTTGKTFKNLKTCNVFLHYFGFRPCGWSYIHEDCTAIACFIGFENNDAAIGGVTYPMNSCALIKCTYASCQSFGLKLRWASQVELVSVNAEKNRADSNMDFFNCDAVTGSIYTEFARAFNSISCRGLVLNVYALGHKDSYVKFFKTFNSIEQFSATSGGSTFTVGAYNSGTEFGIDGFSAMSDTNMIVLKNYKFVSRSGWVKSGDVITLTAPYVNGDIFHVCVNAYQDWSPTSTRVDPFLMTGGTFFSRFSASLNNQFTGFATGFIDGTFTINDGGFSNDTANIWMNPTFRDVPLSDSGSKVMYDPRDGIRYNQVLFNGISFKKIADGNALTLMDVSIHYPATGVGSVTIADAHRYVFILTSAYGSSTFTIDQNGNVSATGGNQDKITVATADVAAGGKLNIYSGTANTLRWNNLTGAAARFQLLRISS